MKRIALALYASLLLACTAARVLPPPVVVVPPVPTGAVGITVTPPIAGLTVHVGPISCTTNEGGVAFCVPVPVGDYTLTFEGLDLATYTAGDPVRVTVTANVTGEVVAPFTRIAPLVPTWSRAQLADFQGDLMIWAPEVGCASEANIHCDAGGLQAGWVWWPSVPRYNAAHRQQLYADALAQGHTHGALQVAQPAADGGYHNLYPMSAADVELYGPLLNTVFDEMVARGLIPICAGVAPGAPVTAGFDASKCQVAMTDWDNSFQADCRIDAIAAAFPHALLYYELPTPADTVTVWPQADACSTVTPGPGNGGAWIRSVEQRHPNFVGVLYEVSQPDGPVAITGMLTALHAWWRDLQEVLFETDTYWKFWANLSQPAEIALNDSLRRQAPWLLGFMSGGTTHAPLTTTAGSSTSVTTQGDGMPIDQVQFVGGPNIGAWPITTMITRLELRTTGVHVEFDKQDGPARWPDTPDSALMGPLQYSIGLALQVNGQWVASAPIELWYGLAAAGGEIQARHINGSDVGQIPANWFYNARWGALAGYQPAVGELIGVFVCAGDARNGVNPIQERSNIVVVPLPADGVPATFTFAP